MLKSGGRGTRARPGLASPLHVAVICLPLISSISQIDARASQPTSSIHRSALWFENATGVCQGLFERSTVPRVPFTTIRTREIAEARRNKTVDIIKQNGRRIHDFVTAMLYLLLY